MFDENVNIGSHNRAGRDQFINIYVKSRDYQELEHKLAEQERDREKLVRRIKKYPDDEDFQQDLRECNKRLAKTRKEIEAFKEDVFRLHELFTRIPIDNERLRRVKAHFDKGEFREADAVLKAGEIQQDVERLKLEEKAAADRLAAVHEDLAGRANEFLLKARLSLLNPVAEGEDRFGRTEGYFKQALAAARTADVLFEYANFLYDYNAFSRAEPLWQEALLLDRSKGEKDPKAFLPQVATTLNNLAILHKTTRNYGLALAEFGEALKIRRDLAKKEPGAFLPKVAMTLNNLAILHSETKDYGPALAEYEEALTLYRDLAENEPDAFLPYVAMTMNNLALLHYATKDYGPALAEYEEALRIRRCLAENEPDAFLPDVAMTLNNLGLLHSDTKDFGPALAEYEEALRIRHELATKEPGAFNQVLATTLLNLSIFYLEAVPDKDKSVASAQEAREILQSLIRQAPHLQGYLDLAEEVLEFNRAKPGE